jgi:phosphate/sulfate permease
MIRKLKFAVALAVAFVLGGVTTFFGMPRSSTATAESSISTAGVSISPEELTRSAGPMPVQVLDNYQ